MRNPKQLKAARVLAGLTQTELSKLSGVSPGRIYALEVGGNHLRSTEDAIIGALQAKGVVFSPDGGMRLEEKPDPFTELEGRHFGDGTLRASQERVALAKQIVESGRKRRTPGGFA